MKGLATTDDVSPALIVSRFIRVPQHLIRFVNGALQRLTEPETFETIGDMTAEETAVIFSQVFQDYLTSGDMFIGSIVPYARLSLPYGVLPCDGSTYQKADYPALYDLLPPTLILNSNQFKTPDLNGRFLAGVGGSVTLADTGGEETHTLTVPEIPSHTHTQTNIIFNVDVEPPLGVPDPSGAGLAPPTQTGSTGGDQPHNNMPPWFGVAYGIVAF